MPNSPVDDAKQSPSLDGKEPLSPVEIVKKVIQTLATDEVAGVVAEIQSERGLTATPAPISETIAPDSDAPALWKQHFNGELQLEQEINRRWPSLPMMASFSSRKLGKQTLRHIATLSAQDGAANLLLEGDPISRHLHISFTWGSMLSLRFTLDALSHIDRQRWLELAQREGSIAFLWGAQRWQRDYGLCLNRKHFTTLLMFSSSRFEAGARLTPSVAAQTFAWLKDLWREEAPSNPSSDANLLTW